MEAQSKEDLLVFVKWMDFLKWFFAATDHFPKKARFTFTDRMTNISLMVVEDLVEARYTRNKIACLRRANMNLEKIRVLMRLCHESKFVSGKSYEHASYQINETGKLLGGWMKQQQGIMDA